LQLSSSLLATNAICNAYQIDLWLRLNELQPYIVSVNQTAASRGSDGGGLQTASERWTSWLAVRALPDLVVMPLCRATRLRRCGVI